MICHSKRNEQVAMVAHRILINLTKKIQISVQDVCNCIYLLTYLNDNI